jgi:hypothetical protein
MRKPKKLPSGANLLAARIVTVSTGQDTPKLSGDSNEHTALKPEKDKNPAAVALGRLGGLKGGKARAKKLSAEDRARIAQRAAKARWKDKD